MKVQLAERNLNLVLLVKDVIDLLPEMLNVLQNTASTIFQRIVEVSKLIPFVRYLMALVAFLELCQRQICRNKGDD